jgi:acyl-coenzyme A thioesterase PaaI-like protein
LFAPYTASCSPHLEEFSIGNTKASIVQRRGLENPFNSIHAAALVNLAEFTSGIALYSLLQQIKGARGIPVAIRIEYFSKARGKITAISNVSLPNKQGKTREDFLTILTDSKGTKVAECAVTWELNL